MNHEAINVPYVKFGTYVFFHVKTLMCKYICLFDHV